MHPIRDGMVTEYPSGTGDGADGVPRPGADGADGGGPSGTGKGFAPHQGLDGDGVSFRDW